MDTINKLYIKYTQNKQVMDANKYIAMIPFSYLYTSKDNQVDYQKNIEMINQKIQNMQEQQLSLQILELAKEYDTHFKPIAFNTSNFKKHYFDEYPFIFQEGEEGSKNQCLFKATINNKIIFTQSLRKVLGNFPNLYELLQNSTFKINMAYNTNIEVEEQKPIKSMLINAQAGAGKTTKLISLFKEISSREKKFNIQFLVFNKENQKQTKDKFQQKSKKQQIHVNTYCSYMKSLLEDHNFTMLNVPIDIEIFKANKQFYNSLLYICNYEKNELFMFVLQKYKEIKDEQYIIDYSEEVFSIYNQMNTVFTSYKSYREYKKLIDEKNISDEQYIFKQIDMLYKKKQMFMQLISVFSYKAIRQGADYNFLSLNYLFLDEVQDIGDCEYMIIRYLIENNENIKVISVGDENQSIYQFKNSLPEVFEKLEQLYVDNDLDYEKIELNKTYRCGNKIVEYVNEESGTQMTAHNTYQYEHMSSEDIMINELDEEYFMQKIIKTVQQNLDNNLDRKITVLSYSNTFNFQLINMIDKQQLNDCFPELKIKIQTNICKEIYYKNISYIKNKLGFNNRKQLQNALTKQNKETNQENNTFTLVFSTIHKYKGLEQQQVIYFEQEMSKKSPHEVKCLNYVAYTRAKNQLNVIKVDCKM